MLSQLANRNLIPFKGYDACPIRNIYMQGIETSGHKKIYQEIRDIGEKEGFNTYYFNGLSRISKDDYPESVKFTTRWTQDGKSFLEKNGNKTVVCDSEAYSYNYPFAKTIGCDMNSSPYFAIGGNTFIGKKPNGERWLLVGMSEPGSTNLEEFSKFYDVKPEDIHFLTQPNFHLDMAIRPIGYPYVLVNDEELVKEKVKDDPELSEKVGDYYYCLHSAHMFSPIPYSDTEGTIRELKRAGFVPIRVAGVFGDDINYMNAIVNKHPDDTLTYITNSSKGSQFEKTDEIFLKNLKETLPNIRNVHFVSGGLNDKNQNRNEIMYHLGELRGGVHCLTLEEPDFDVWG